MVLYFSPLSCSFAVRVVAMEAGVALDLQEVDVFSKALPGAGGSYLDVSRIGLVPLLRLDDGTLLSEVLAISTWLAEQGPGSGLLPAQGTPERYQVLSWHSFIACELHKRILWPIANPGPPPAAKDYAKSAAAPVLDHLARHLDGREHLAGATFTIADAYLTWALTLAPILGLPLGERPALHVYAKRMQARPSVSSTFAQEVPLARAAMKRQGVNSARDAPV